MNNHAAEIVTLKYFGVKQRKQLDTSKMKALPKKLHIQFQKLTIDELTRSIGKELFQESYVKKKDSEQFVSFSNLFIEKGIT